MPLATDIYSGNVFRFMKSEQSMAGEDSKPKKTSSELAGTHFTKNSDKNSGVQKVQNQNNCGILRNSEWISQPSAKPILVYPMNQKAKSVSTSAYISSCTSSALGHDGSRRLINLPALAIRATQSAPRDLQGNFTTMQGMVNMCKG
jgi:hypothetical protein